MWLTILICVIATAVYMVFMLQELPDQKWSVTRFTHLPFAFGIPGAAAAAVVICSIFRQTDGKVTFKVLNIELSGAAGPLLFWNITFLNFVVAMRLLWPLIQSLPAHG
jgi:hypothetical protein